MFGFLSQARQGNMEDRNLGFDERDEVGKSWQKFPAETSLACHLQNNGNTARSCLITWAISLKANIVLGPCNQVDHLWQPFDDSERSHVGLSTLGDFQ